MCWLIGIATFLEISYYEACVLMFGGPPSDRGNFGRPIEEMEARLLELGFRRARKDYKNAKENRLVVLCWRFPNGYFRTLHVVTWEAAKRITHDPQWSSKGSLTVRVYRRPNIPLVTGVTKGLQNPRELPKPEPKCSNVRCRRRLQAAAFGCS